jgi:hypothetical protein
MITNWLNIEYCLYKNVTFNISRFFKFLLDASAIIITTYVTLVHLKWSSEAILAVVDTTLEVFARKLKSKLKMFDSNFHCMMVSLKSQF